MDAETVYASRAEVAELDRQVERGSLFAQAALERGFRRLGQAESLLTSLIETLATRGVVSPEELGVTFATGDEDEAEPGEHDDGEAQAVPAQPRIGWPTIALRVDNGEQGDQPEVLVDCDARMHVCHAVCCKLKFPLTSAEVDAGHVKWDIGHPYIIRHDSSGYCCHNDTATGHCGVYADRPAICRRYSCAGDTRIWKDFDNMVLNQEWIDEHLAERDLHVEAVMPPMEPASSFT